MDTMKESENFIVNLFKRLRPRIVSEYTIEKILDKKVEAANKEYRHAVEDSLGTSLGDYINPDGEKGEKIDPFYQAVAHESDDVYTQYYADQNKDSTNKLFTKISESVSSFLANRGILSTAFSFIERRQPTEIREAVQASMYIKSYEEAHVKAIVENMRRFVQGRGTKFNVQVPEIQEKLVRFWKLNKMAIKEKQIMHNGMAESEAFLTFFINGQTGDTKIRQNSPFEITAVETDPEDIETILSYTREFRHNKINADDPEAVAKGETLKKIYPDIDYFIQRDNGPFPVTSRHENADEWQGNEGGDEGLVLMQFVKLGKNREVRSRVVLQPILKWIRIYTNWLKDRAVLNHERARVVWILTLNGKLAETEKRHKIAPSSGVTRVETEGRKWRAENASINADDAKDDGRALLHAVATAAEMPVSVFAQIVDDAVYASIKKADTPYTQLILDLQDTWKEFYKDMMRVVVRANVKYGELKDTFTIKKFLQEHHKKAFDIQKIRFDKKEINETEMLKILREVVRDFLTESQFNNDFENSPEGGRQFTEQCIEFIEDMTENIVEVMESEDHKVNIEKQINKFMILYEKGIEVTVDAEDVPIEIVFPQVVKEDPLEQAKTLLILQKIGVSFTSLMTMAGYDPEREAALRAVEKEDGTFDDLIAQLSNTNNDRFNNKGDAPDLKKNSSAAGDDTEDGGDE